MHVCKDYVTDSCSNGATCHWNHSFHNGKDRVWLSRIKLDQFIEEELRWLVLTSTPQICAEYNNGICQDGSSCTRIHTCIAYLLRRCKASGCGLSHEKTMRSEQNRAVLDWYQVTDLDSGYLDQLILMNEEPVKKGDTANSKVRICNSVFPQTQGIPTRLLQVPKPNYHKQCCPSLKYFQEQHPGCWRSPTAIVVTGPGILCLTFTDEARLPAATFPSMKF